MHFKTNAASLLDATIDVIAEASANAGTATNFRLIVYTALGTFAGRLPKCDDDGKIIGPHSVIITQLLEETAKDLEADPPLTGEVGYFFLVDVDLYTGLNIKPQKIPFAQLFSDQILGMTIGELRAESN